MENTPWQPSASLATLHQRAKIIQAIRGFFISRGYLEVETPILAHYGITDLYLSNIQATFRNKIYNLQTSPEYHMKRLLAAGSGPIFQLARVFRDDELGRWHNPEFTLLEWYQLGIDHHQLLLEMDVFLQEIVHCEPIVKKTYEQVFLEACDFNPLEPNYTKLQTVLMRYNLQTVFCEKDTSWDQYLYLLMSHIVEPYLQKINAPVAVYNFPASQAALAKVENGVAERFEIYYRGVELANGFHELTDATTQRIRFKQDNALRQAHSIEPNPPDEWLLQALEYGLPPCSGVALGVDRLLAVCLSKQSIAETQAFDFSRA